jgi:hypothetical protein
MSGLCIEKNTKLLDLKAGLYTILLVYFGSSRHGHRQVPRIGDHQGDVLTMVVIVHQGAAAVLNWHDQCYGLQSVKMRR